MSAPSPIAIDLVRRALAIVLVDAPLEWEQQLTVLEHELTLLDDLTIEGMKRAAEERTRVESELARMRNSNAVLDESLEEATQELSHAQEDVARKNEMVAELTARSWRTQLRLTPLTTWIAIGLLATTLVGGALVAGRGARVAVAPPPPVVARDAGGGALPEVLLTEAEQQAMTQSLERAVETASKADGRREPTFVVGFVEKDERAPGELKPTVALLRRRPDQTFGEEMATLMRELDFPGLTCRGCHGARVPTLPSAVAEEGEPSTRWAQAHGRGRAVGCTVACKDRTFGALKENRLALAFHVARHGGPRGGRTAQYLILGVVVPAKDGSIAARSWSYTRLCPGCLRGREFGELVQKLSTLPEGKRRCQECCHLPARPARLRLKGEPLDIKISR